MSPDGGAAALWLDARVVDRRALDPATGLTWLALDATPWVEAAGQYVQVVTSDGAGGEVVRYVSLASAPGARAELLVGRGEGRAEAGELSALAVGDALRISARAAGRLTLRSVPTRPVLWLFAAGTGLAPLRAIVASGEARARFDRVVLVHSVRQARQLAFADEFVAAHAAGWLTYVSAITGTLPAHRASQPSPSPSPVTLRGRIPAAIDDGTLERLVGAPLGPDVAAALICGGSAMVGATRQALERRGLHRHDAGREAPPASPEGTIVTEW